MSSHLPEAEKTNLRIGYMPLADSAPLILAQELGLFRDQGLQVELVREVSWANLRDRLVVGDLDAAQLLSPLPLVTSYGAAGLRANLITGLVLSVNGNAVTLSTELWSQLGCSERQAWEEPLEVSRALQALTATRTQKPALTFATVHLFSMHTLLLRQWLVAGGVDPDRDVRIIVLPPAQMCDSLARGIIDGYCVGEPWNSVAVQQGLGVIAATGRDIWSGIPEKVLGVSEAWHHHYPQTHLHLRLALMRACQALAEPGYRAQAVTLLHQAGYLNLPEQCLRPSLSGLLQFSKQSEPVAIRDFHLFWEQDACFPWRSAAEAMLRHCAFAMPRSVSEEELRALAQRCYRTDLYREAARYLELPAPDQDWRQECAVMGQNAAD